MPPGFNIKTVNIMLGFLKKSWKIVQKAADGSWCGELEGCISGGRGEGNEKLFRCLRKEFVCSTCLRVIFKTENAVFLAFRRILADLAFVLAVVYLTKKCRM